MDAKYSTENCRCGDLVVKRVMLSWSSGKDSAWSLYQLQNDPEVEVVGLMTTVNAAANRVAMHAVRTELLESQARAADLPLFSIPLPWPCSNADYEEIMTKVVVEIREKYQATHVAFGDLFLEDIRAYREKQMQDSGLELMFPLWQNDTKLLADEMIAAGLKAVLTCIDPKQLDLNFAGKKFDQDLVNSLPEHVDPCGENGEFHSFVYAGPMFKADIQISIGETVERDGFVYTDVLAETGDSLN